MNTRQLVARFGLAAVALAGPPAALADEKPAANPTPTASRQVDFIRDIQPLLKRSCYRCHGPEKQQSGYRLDLREIAISGGDAYAPNIIPGKSKESSLLRFVTGNGETVMPPEGNRLAADEVALIRAWIDQGAAWPDAAAGKIVDKADWWSLKPLLRPVVPRLEAPCANGPLDAFVEHQLRSKHLAPAQEADRQTLIRRLSFNLIGLPPSPSDVQSFLADDAADAYERLVDQLLSSPAHGERWARHWLDAAHFAETHGHDQDRIRENAWPYRDYLIAAFNTDQPYRQFIQEQVAGDLLFPENSAANVALGFIAAGPWDESTLSSIREDTLDRQMGRYLDRDDMLTTVVNNFCSMTVQCARCHDHKFDPISQQDYYALQAVFAGAERADRAYEPSPAVQQRRLALFLRRDQLNQRDPQALAGLNSAEVQRQVVEWEKGLREHTTDWKPLDAVSVSSAEGATLTKLPDFSVLAGGKRPEVDTYTFLAGSSLEKITALRLEVLADDSLPMHGPGRQDNGNLHLSELQLFVEGVDQPLPLVNPVADFDQTDWGIARAIDGVESTAWGIHPQVGKSHQATLELKEPLRLLPGVKIRIVLAQRHGRGHLIGRFRLSVTDHAPPVRFDFRPEPIAAILAIPAAQRTPPQVLELAIFQQQQATEHELALLPKPRMIYAAAGNMNPDGAVRPPVAPRPVHRLHRGDIRQPRELAAPGAISCLPDLPPRFTDIPQESEAARRAALARWISDPKNPLTWRSIVNRVWHHHFGRGLVATINDFGHMGETPSHLDLLDWLAVEFRDGDQGLKALHRRIVTSAAYRQSCSPSAQTSAQAAAIDADNRLLWRMNRLRLDAESVRDAVLVAAGRLDARMGGPSDRQFDLQPGIHVTPKIDYAKFDHGSLAGSRRSIYRFLFRTLPDPFMETLDCPTGEQITPGRVNSVTVQQALAMWNDAFITRHCELFAGRLELLPGSPQDRVAAAIQLVYARPPATDELRDLTAYAQKHGLANLCRLLFNGNEFLFVN